MWKDDLQTAATLTGYDPRSDIPHEKQQHLALAVADARQAAEEGKFRLGYSILLRGFFQAEQFLVEREVWAAALIRCWRDAIDDYCSRFEPAAED